MCFEGKPRLRSLVGAALLTISSCASIATPPQPVVEPVGLERTVCEFNQLYPGAQLSKIERYDDLSEFDADLPSRAFMFSFEKDERASDAILTESGVQIFSRRATEWREVPEAIRTVVEQQFDRDSVGKILRLEFHAAAVLRALPTARRSFHVEFKRSDIRRYMAFDQHGELRNSVLQFEDDEPSTSMESPELGEWTIPNSTLNAMERLASTRLPHAEINGKWIFLGILPTPVPDVLYYQIDAECDRQHVTIAATPDGGLVDINTHCENSSSFPAQARIVVDRVTQGATSAFYSTHERHKELCFEPLQAPRIVYSVRVRSAGHWADRYFTPEGNGVQCRATPWFYSEGTRELE